MTRAIPVQCSTNWSLPYSFLNLQYIWNQRNDQLPVGLLSQLVERGTFGQCTDHWTTEQSRGVGVPAVQLTTHVKSSTLYSRTSKFFRLDGLLFCIIMGLRSASSAIILYCYYLLIPQFYLNKLILKLTLSLCFSALSKARWRRRHKLLQSSTRDKLQRIDLKLPVYSVISTVHVV